jgi:hypothetical protein
MTDKLDEQQAGQSSRVSMVWPADLKEQVRRTVGARGMTEFTLDAVRDKLAKMQTTVSNEPSDPEPPPTKYDHYAKQLNGTVTESTGPALDPRPGDGFAMDPAEVAKLPLAQRMAQARKTWRDPAAQHCSDCGDELVNGECWTCPPKYGPQA